MGAVYPAVYPSGYPPLAFPSRPRPARPPMPSPIPFFSHSCALFAKSTRRVGSRQGLLGGRNRGGAHWLGFTAEGQLEFTGNLRPEFAEHVETDVLKDAEADLLRCWSEAAFVVRAIGVGQHDRARRPQPFGKIEHALAIVAVSHDRVLQRMQQARAGAAVGQAVVAGVLRKYPGIRKVLKEPGSGLTGEFRAKAPAVALSALSIAGVRVFRLVKPRVETSGEKGHRVKRVLDEQLEFIFQLEGTQYRARLVMRGVYGLAFQRPGEGANGLFQWSVVVFQPHHGRRLNARCRRILRSFLRERHSGRLLKRSRRRLRTNLAAS